MAKKRKKPKMEFRYYQMPAGSPILALLGQKWVQNYGNDVDYLHFHNYLEIGFCSVFSQYDFTSFLYIFRYFCTFFNKNIQKHLTDYFYNLSGVPFPYLLLSIFLFIVSWLNPNNFD